MLFKFAVESFLSAKSVAHLRIEEYNDDAPGTSDFSCPLEHPPVF